jgi:hypothetical protein
MGAGVIAHDLIRAAAVSEVAMPAGARPFIDRPVVTALSMRLRSGAGEEVGLETAIDILARGQGRLPVTGVDAPRHPSIAPGVQAHVAERLAIGDASPELRLQALPIGVGAVFDKAAQEGVPLTVLRDVAELDGRDMPGDADRLLREALQTGHVVVLPERAVELGGTPRLGWWLIDVERGEAIDQMDDGRGVSGLEDTIPQRAVVIRSGPSYLKMGICMGAAAAATALILYWISLARQGGTVSAGEAVLGTTGGVATGGAVVACGAVP